LGESTYWREEPGRETRKGRCPLRIISGGQTGVDRAALDVALEREFSCGGWCPRGRLAEDGPIPSRYPLEETPEADYAQRTEWNIRDSDATLILAQGEPTGGTAFTIECARGGEKPYFVVDLASGEKPDRVVQWIIGGGIEILNVAGPRESTAPGVYRLAVDFLRRVFPRSD
jgi:hypothetical protein